MHIIMGSVIMEPLRVSFYYPFDVAVRGYSESTPLLESTLAWATRAGMVAARSARYDSLRQSRTDMFATFAFPSADGHVAQFIADFIGWYLLLDDRLEQSHGAGRATFEGYLSALRGEQAIGGAEPREPLLATCRDVGARARRLSSPAWFARFHESMRTYFYQGIEVEIEMVRSASCPSIEEYARMRVETSGAYPVFDLVEIVGGYELPGDIAGDSTINALRNAAAMAISWANDVLSYHKEKRRDRTLGLPRLLMRRTGISERHAIEHGVMMHNQEVARFLHLKERLPSWGAQADRMVARWIEGIETVMRGLLDWQYLADRYRMDRVLHVEVVTSLKRFDPASPSLSRG